MIGSSRLASVIVLLGVLWPPEAISTSVCVSEQEMLRGAEEWFEGRPIPEGYRRFRSSDGCFGRPTDTTMLLSKVTNEGFLVALALDPAVDDDTHEEAMQRGLYFLGPTRFLGRVRNGLSKSADAGSWYRELHRRLDLKHVVVDALFVDYSDMPAAQANAVFTRIEGELRSGNTWKATYEKYANEFGYSTGSRTKVGNLGDFVIYPDPALIGNRPFRERELPGRFARLSWLPASHVPALLRASARDLLRLEDSYARMHVLYQVREVYQPKELLGDSRALKP